MTDVEVLARLRDAVSAIDSLPPADSAHKQLGVLTGAVCDALREMRALGEVASSRAEVAVCQLESATQAALDLQTVDRIMQS